MSKPLILELKEKIEKVKLTTLYSNENGSKEDISLSDNNENYDYLLITLAGTNNEETIRIDNANEKEFYKTFEYSLANDHVKVFSRFAITKNKIKVLNGNCGYTTISYINNLVYMHLDNINYISIKKVVGGKNL